jgi:TatA/E family protein of Tat protein translocase
VRHLEAGLGSDFETHARSQALTCKICVCLLLRSVPGARLALLPCCAGQYDGEMSLGFSDTGFLFFLALLLFGPKKLPEIGRQIGKVLNEFKRASNEFRSQIEAEIATLERDKEPTPQILPPSTPPPGAVASGTLVDAPDPVPHPESDPAPDAAHQSGPILENTDIENIGESNSVAKAPHA